MDTNRIALAIKNNEINTVESLWMDDLDQPAKASDVREILDDLVKSGQVETAKMLAWALMEAKTASDAPAQSLELAKASLLALPKDDDLRSQTAELYERVHSEHANYDDFLAASGLKAGQSPRRAIRTLDTCLLVEEGSFLANRFDHRVISIKNFDASGGEFNALESDQQPISFEPKALADEFEILAPEDFRVLKQNDPKVLKEMFKKDIVRILIGMCIAAGGKTSSDQLKKELTDGFIPTSQWSRWWSRARIAAKNSEYLTIEGKSPVTIEYHADGLSLKDEFAPALSQANTASEHLDIARAFLTQAGKRKSPETDTATSIFLEAVTDILVKQVNAFVARRTDEALEAALAIEALIKMGSPKSEQNHPSASEILKLQKQPAQSIAALTDAAFWSIALKALACLDDAPDQLEKLLYLAPANQISAIADLLIKADKPGALGEAITIAMINPLDQIDLVLWAWNAPDGAMANPPRKIDLLARLLKALHEVIHSYQGPAEFRRSCQHKIRAAMGIGSFASYRQTIDEMDESTAAVMKNRIERADGLAQTVRDEMLSILRQSYYKLFLAVQIAPWLNEGIIWTTQSALDRRKADYKYLNDVTITANANQIGEAAAQGDLSENADWEAAIAERDMLKARANAMQAEISKARVLEPEEKQNDEIVYIGAKVRVGYVNTGEKIDLTFLGPWDSDTENNVFCYTTKLALQFMGKNLGDEITAPIGGADILCVIEEISSAIV